jgi:hypothetical protein
MRFEYNNKIDKKCWEVVNATDLIFGESKKTQVYPVNKELVNEFKKLWHKDIEESFDKGMCQIFGKEFPKDFVCYINSTPYSMDLEEGISISASTKAPIRTICHEANHYMFRKSTYRDIYFSKHDIEDAKEIFTIINNIYFQDIMEDQDIGWNKFWKERYGFLNSWKKYETIQ